MRKRVLLLEICFRNRRLCLDQTISNRGFESLPHRPRRGVVFVGELQRSLQQFIVVNVVLLMNAARVPG